MLVKLSTQINYKVPAGPHCGECRFNQKHKGQHICVLHNLPLAGLGREAVKCAPCAQQCMSPRALVVVDEHEIDVAALQRHAVKNYKKAVAALVKQGVPRDLAEEMASK